MNIAIIGCGPSGLMAAHACSQRDCNIEIFSDKIVKPRAIGFQYLHDPCGLDIENRPLEEEVLVTDKFLSEQAYSLKTYGKLGVPNVLSRWGIPTKGSWNLQQAIDILWSRYEYAINRQVFYGISDIQTFSSDYDLVFCSIPLDNIYYKDCLRHVSNFIYYDTVPYNTNHVIYDTSFGSPVTRYGVIFNQFFIESSVHLPYDMPVVQVSKVINSGSLPELNLGKSIVLIGRYGEWNKSILIHDVYKKVLKVLDDKRTLGTTV